jgi:dTDP-4-amino-4,6-dideoxygalactose transaminase
VIPFNKPYVSGREISHIQEALNEGHLSGNGTYTKKCQRFFEERYGFRKTLLTTSCTDALEMCALLLKLIPGDEVIVPSYTFVSSALAFVREGARIVFADSREDHPGIDESEIESHITSRTKAIVVVHYAGVACDMDVIMDIAARHNLVVIEDCAKSIDSYYTGSDGVQKALGSMGHLATFSFHATKNVHAGEGGLLVINDEQYVHRSEVLWEKGTNRSEFYRGEVNKYGWIDVGSSFLPSELTAAFLWSQLEELDSIQHKRKQIWSRYNEQLVSLKEKIQRPFIPDYATNNAHMYYIVCRDFEERSNLIDHLKSDGISAVFHYLSLHKSEYYKNKHSELQLIHADRYTECLLRLPFYNDLTESDQDKVINSLMKFLGDKMI